MRPEARHSGAHVDARKRLWRTAVWGGGLSVVAPSVLGMRRDSGLAGVGVGCAREGSGGPRGSVGFEVSSWLAVLSGLDADGWGEGEALEKEFGDKIVTSFVESVPESADAERVFRDMAGQGNKLIFGTTFGYMEPMLKVAPDFKDVKFEHATGYKSAENLRSYDSRTYEGAYMAGVIAGKMTKSNTLGFVGSIPIPEVIRNINSFTLGAQSVNPKISTKVVWVNEWFSPPKETEAATALINGGADVLFQNTDSPAVLKTAQEKGKRAFGWDSDMTAYGPKAHLASAVINWTPYYTKATQDMLDGKWTTGQTWWGVKEGAIDLVSIAEDVPAEAKAKVEEVKKGLKDGSFSIWKGPIVDQDGKEVVAAGAVADDKFLSGVNFYVKGVEGKVPGGDKK
jgi:basic membrane protein A